MEPANVNERPGQVRRALNAIRKSPDTRALKRVLEEGNPYAHAFIAKRGLTFENGTITRRKPS